MDNWIAIGFVVIAVVMIIGNFSTVQKSSKTPLRKNSLNDLKETLPRSNKTEKKMDTFKKK